MSRLVLAWMPGLPTAPVQRWVLYEVLPHQAVVKILDDEAQAGVRDSLVRHLWAELQRGDPRNRGRWVGPLEDRQWESDADVSRTQWDVYRQTNGLPFLTWIIEGERGGHGWTFGLAERRFLLTLGVPFEAVEALGKAWPNPGDLPYAPYDQRVFEALAQRDKLLRYQQGMPWDVRSARKHASQIVRTDVERARREMAAQMFKFIDDQIGAAVSDIPRRLLPNWSDLPTTDERVDEDRVDAELETLVSEV